MVLHSYTLEFIIHLGISFSILNHLEKKRTKTVEMCNNKLFVKMFIRLLGGIFVVLPET